MTAAVLDRPTVPDMTAEQAGAWADVALSQQGDGDAFGRLYNRYAFTIYKFINGRVKHIPTAEDLTSDVFVRAFRRIAFVQWQGKDLGAWLVTIARNVVTDHFKSLRHRTEFAMEIHDFDSHAVGSIASKPVHADVPVLQQVDHDTLLAAIATLSPPQQDVIRCRFLEQLNLGETAARLGKTSGAIKALQCRAIKALAGNEALVALWRAER
jgi:RNA polymerase sigma-70 factor (ECF subfamily)